MHDKILLIDLTNLIYRFFFAFIRNPLRNSKGFNTSAIYGVTSFLREVLKKEQIQYAVCAVDLKQKTFRHDLFADYKSGRQDTPDELISQINPIYDAIEKMGIKIASVEGFEADDVIGTLSKRFKDEFEKIMIVTSDKDMGQLLNENTFILYPKKENGSYPLLDLKSVEEKLGIKQRQITDYFALIGDAVDSVPGIEGIGPKTAEKILKEAESVDDMVEHPEKITNEKIRKKISEKRAELILYKKLVTINTEVPLKMDAEDAKIIQADNEQLNRLFKEYELYSMVGENQDSLAKKMTFKKENSAERVFEESGILTVFLFDDNIVLNSQTNEFIGERSSLDSPTIQKAKKKNIVTNNLKALKELHPIIGEAEIFDIPLISQTQMRHGGLERIVREYTNGSSETQDYLSLSETFCSFKEKYVEESRNDLNYNVYRQIELPIIPAICAMEEEGIKANREFFYEEKKKLSAKLHEYENEIYEMAGCRFNINSPKQVGEVLFQKLKIKSQRKTKTGFSTDSQVLDSLSEENPIAKRLLGYRELSKLLGGFIEPILQITIKDDIVRTTFEQSFAATGRFSSRNPNMQNVPPNIRRGFTVRDPNNQFLSVDYSQIELRVLAVLSKDENLIEAFKENRDIHNQTAMHIFDVPEDMIDEKMRSVAKVVNFSVLYGKTPFGLSQELKIPRREAERFIDSYFQEYVQVKEWIEKTKAETLKTKRAETIFKRVRQIPEISSSNKTVREQAERIAVNMPVQGTAADIIKIAIRKVYEKIKDKKDIKMILTIHDELVFEVKENSMERYRNIIEETMTDIEGFKDILKVKSSAGKLWSEI
ncbi:MAG: DNA polymerase [bacterium]|nr:DNA polymerase [bacterium]